MNTPMKYLDKALTQLRDLGLLPNEQQEAPIVALLNRISDLDEDRVVAIARTLSQASLFNEVVREQITAMTIGERYETITGAFDSIRKDAKSMVEQFEDGDISAWERLHNIWVKVTRGDIAQRFDKIKKIYLEVADDTREQIERERVILTAYMDFRGALKESEVLAFEVLEKAEAEVERAKASLDAAVKAVEADDASDPAARAQLELRRDEQLRVVQNADDRYQITKDLSDNLTVGYNTSEVVMARLMQTTNAKDRVYKQAISFFGTNETVLTALSASFTGLHGLHESTKTVDAMKEGVSQSLEDLADIGGKVQEAALKAGYGPTIRAEAVKKLVESVVNYQTRSREIIDEMRELATKNARDIRDAVEDGKRRLARLVEEGNAPPLSLPVAGES
ncbi:MAG TPA: cell surface protein [Gammaproteobacteria bacterium]|nr:cell surface protein [Gammaproteobacteria bacterium]